MLDKLKAILNQEYKKLLDEQFYYSFSEYSRIEIIIW